LFISGTKSRRLYFTSSLRFSTPHEYRIIKKITMP